MKIDFTKLLGFDIVSRELTAGVDFRSDSLGDKLGAKVGGGESTPAPSLPKVDFQNDIFGGRLGAKISSEVLTGR